MQQQPQQVQRPTYWQNLYQYGWVIAALWVVEVVDGLFFSSRLEGVGIHPGNWSHWEGIFLAPFLHGDMGHLAGNSLGLAIFGSIILRRGWQVLAMVSFYAIIAGGLVVMVFGAYSSVHIGASGVVYGYWAYIIGLGFYERTGASVLIAILVIAVYGGFFYGMVPSDHNSINHISWQGHLGGALGGLAAARQRIRS